MKEILERSGGKLVPVIYETLRTYNGKWLSLAKVQIVKLRALMDPFEIPNNASFYYGLEISPILSITLRYAMILPLGLAGLVFAVCRKRLAPLLLLYGGAMSAGLLVAPIMARYRLLLVPVLILYAAEGLTWFAKNFRASPLIPTIYPGAVLALALAQYIVAIPYSKNWATDLMLHGGLEYHFAAVMYAEENRFEKSIAELRRLEESALDTPNSLLYSSQARYEQGIFYAKWAEGLLKSGDRAGANEKARQAESKFSAYFNIPEASVIMGILYYDLQEGNKAQTYLKHALRIEAEGADAEIAKTYLGKLAVSPVMTSRDGK
jgi:tetratricopeptide (TPR) repeat protein